MDGTLDLRDFLRLISRRRWLIAVAMAALSGLMLYRSAGVEPTYQATSKMVIGPDTVSNRDAERGAERGSDLSLLLLGSRDYIASFAEQLRGRPLAEQVVERLGLDILPTELAGNISTDIIDDTRIIRVTYTDNDPARAALIANEVVETFAATQKRQGTVEGLQASPFEAALVPSGPVAPRPMRDGLMGLFLGAMLGVGAAVGLEQMDTRLRSRDEVENAVQPAKVLSEIPAGPRGGDNRKLWLESAPGTPVAEAFRILRTNLQFLAVERRINTLLVTSPSPSEGKTTVAANLAASMAAGGYRTLLVDGDLRHPTVHTYFGIDHRGGLSDVLAGTLERRAAIRDTGFPNLSVMTAGPQPPNPSELFGSQRMQTLVGALESEYDLVVFDAPPTLIVADAPALSTRVDGVVFVVRANVTTREQAREALRRFSLLDTRILGAVLNASKRVRTESYYGYSAYYGTAPDAGPAADLQPSVQPATRAPRVEDNSGRGIDHILADLEKMSSRRRRELRSLEGGAVVPNGASPNGTGRGAPVDAAATYGMVDEPAGEVPNPGRTDPEQAGPA